MLPCGRPAAAAVRLRARFLLPDFATAMHPLGVVDAAKHAPPAAIS